MSWEIDGFNSESSPISNCTNEVGAHVKNGVQLLEGLSAVYSEYTRKSSEKNSKSRLNQLFGKWFSRGDPLAILPVHQEFLDAVACFTSDLASVLESINESAPEACSDFAGKALDIMFAPKPNKEMTDAEWYLIIAQYKSTVLFSYASINDLLRIRSGLLKRTPKRLMFPKQREMLELMDTIILEKRGAK